MELSEGYILNALYTYAQNPTFNKYDSTYNAGCPICREGKSWGKKKRLFYYPKTKTFYCFNCSESWTAAKWINQVSGIPYKEMAFEDSSNDFSKEILVENQTKKFQLPSLPFDSINLMDETQINFYQNNKFVVKALEYIQKRRLNTAINKIDRYYMSFTDSFHKNRLVIPFFDQNGKIIFYQSRALDDSHPRYLGKTGYDKSIFGIDKIDPDFEYIFLFEGAIDSMFVKNAVGLSGLTLSDTQNKQLAEFPFHQRIWVLDNISVVKDKETKEKTLKLLNQNEKVFRWGNRYKDVNDWCVKEELDSIDPDIFIKNLY